MKKIINYVILHLVGNRNAKGIRISHQLKYYRRFNRMQWRSLEENREQQRKRLYAMVKYAVENVPYYKDLGITNFSEETIFEDIEKFPILTKEIIRREGKRMLPECTIKDWTYWDQSGGTTGEPLKFLHSGAFFDEGQGIALALDAWAGRKLGDSQVRLWGSERDFVTGKKDWMNKIYRWAKNEQFLNTFMMDEQRIQEYLKLLEKHKPKMILAYVQSLREIALYAQRNNIKIYSPRGIMTSAGTLTKEMAEHYREIFNCVIINRYGSREAGPIACSCEKNEGLHVNMMSNYIEILDDDNRRSKEGRVILTLLNEYAMPLIRYDIGDSASFSDKVCTCGRGLEMLDSVHGRKTDFFRTSDGKKVHGEFFTHLLYSVSEVKQFQIVQDQLKHILVKLVLVDDNVDKKFEEKLSEDIRKILGEDVIVEIEETAEIPVEKSGKRAFTISLIS